MKMEKMFRAVERAAAAHSGQFRKGTLVPYLIHPLRVAKTLIDLGCEEDLVVAGVLHDTVEDTEMTLEDIEREFGKRVADLVEGCSEHDVSDTWERRKEFTVKKLESAPDDVLLVSCADKHDNILALRTDLDKFGESIWKRFNRPKEKQEWYYRSLRRVFVARMTEGVALKLATELSEEVERVFGPER